MNTTNAWDTAGTDLTANSFLERTLPEKRENEWLDLVIMPNADRSEDLLDPHSDVESTIAGNHTSGSSNLRSWGRTFDESSRSLAIRPWQGLRLGKCRNWYFLASVPRLKNCGSVNGRQRSRNVVSGILPHDFTGPT